MAPKKKKFAAKAAPPKDASAPGAGKFNHIVNKPFRKCLEQAGTIVKFCADLKVSRQAVHKWEAIPERLAVECERLYGVSRKEIAPELYKGM